MAYGKKRLLLAQITVAAVVIAVVVFLHDPKKLATTVGERYES